LQNLKIQLAIYTIQYNLQKQEMNGERINNPKITP